MVIDISKFHGSANATGQDISKISFKKFNKDSKISDKDFEKLKGGICDLEGEKFDAEGSLKEAYDNIMDCLKKYIDIDPLYYPIISLWVIGTYFHESFRSYPFLYFNAMKGSGKTRTLKLVTYLSKGGELLNQPTEAVLFRTNGMLAIDEFEGVGRRGNENLRELLNSAYKKGAKVKRMKKKKTVEGEEQVVEEFDVYRPICLANIWGMDNVLGDRCISVVLEKSTNKTITRLMELFDTDFLTTRTKELLLRESVVWCSVLDVENTYMGWNDYVTTNYTTTRTSNYTKLHTLFEKIKESEIDGRVLELTMPLIIIASALGEDMLNQTIKIIKKIIEDKKVDDIYHNKDVAIIDFISQATPTVGFVSVTELTNNFKDFLGEGEEWINTRFVGKALERLKLIIQKKRMNRGIYVVLNYEKAQAKIKMFR